MSEPKLETSKNERPIRSSKASALVLGGGFAGLETAISLSKHGLAVTLVCNRREMFIYSTSIWMVTGEHRRRDIEIKVYDTLLW